MTNKYGNYYMVHYEGQIQIFRDEDGTDYDYNQHLAQFEYKWTHGPYGIGYYLQYKY